MATPLAWLRWFRPLPLTLAGLVLGGVAIPSQSFGDVTLEAKLVPAIMISGQPGSLQEIQYSTNLSDASAWTVLSMVRLDASPKPYYDAAADGSKRFYRTKTVGVADTNLIWIPPGSFLMGSPTNEQARSANEGPQTLVTLTNGFLMGRYEITVGEFVAYTNFPSVALTNSFKVPADSVSWLMASNYCAWRTDYERQNGMISSNWYYRLPTEAEWEYACRAGSTNAFGIGTGMELRNDALRQDASFLGSFPYPTNLVAVGAIAQAAPAVGSYAPNAFGLYDMHGSTRELCWDYLGISLPGGSVTNLVGSVGEGFNGVRGGSSDDPASDCRSARRKMVQSSIRLTRADFRVVLVIDE